MPSPLTIIYDELIKLYDYEQTLLESDLLSDAYDDSPNSSTVTSSNPFQSEDPLVIEGPVRVILSNAVLYETLVDFEFNVMPNLASMTSGQRKRYETFLITLLVEYVIEELRELLNTNGDFSDQEERARPLTPSPRQVSVLLREVQRMRDSSVQTEENEPRDSRT